MKPVRISVGRDLSELSDASEHLLASSTWAPFMLSSRVRPSSVTRVECGIANKGGGGTPRRPLDQRSILFSRFRLVWFLSFLQKPVSHGNRSHLFASYNTTMKVTNSRLQRVATLRWIWSSGLLLSYYTFADQPHLQYKYWVLVSYFRHQLVLSTRF